MDQFNKLVTWINNNSNNNFTINEHDTSSILKNAWLRPIKIFGCADAPKIFITAFRRSRAKIKKKEAEGEARLSAYKNALRAIFIPRIY
jgi:hypothetical protein